MTKHLYKIIVNLQYIINVYVVQECILLQTTVKHLVLIESSKTNTLIPSISFS